MTLNKQLAATVLATFREVDLAQQAPPLRMFSVKNWKSSFHWLDASGLALYFLHRLRVSDNERLLPDSVLSALEERQHDNQLRTAQLFEEFVRLNSCFQQSGIAYVNLKGFTLVPDYCSDLSSRYQTDFDFLVRSDDANRCGEILKSLGYELVAANNNVMEFKTGNGRIPRLKDLYKVQLQHSVELHICDEASPGLHPDLIRRSRTISVDGCACPALSVQDMFLSQVQHLFHHLCSEWIRISWLLEFKHFIENYKNDDFWRALRMKLEGNRALEVSLGVVGKLAQAAFGSCGVNQLTERSIARLPASVALWVEQYGGDVLLSDFPGSKLYLFLQQALGDHASAVPRLFPVRLPGRIVAGSAQGSGDRAIAAITRWRYFFFRLRFHLRANAQYIAASCRRGNLYRTLAIKPPDNTSACISGAGD
jgi:hypothetical protein